MFIVTAGKYDDQEPNCKYSDSFETLDDAIKAYDLVMGYPWQYIEYQGRTIEVWSKGNKPFN